MSRLLVHLIFATFSFILLSISTWTFVSARKSFGSKMCRDLCQRSDDSVSFMEQYRCHQIAVHDSHRTEERTPLSSYICLDQMKAAEGANRPITSDSAKDKPVDTHGSTCQDDSVCKFKGSLCLKGFCHCNVGYYYHPKMNKCVPRCGTYADKMVVYKFKGIANHNKQCFSNVSEDECLMKCQNETSFVCLTAEAGTLTGRGRVCYLSDVGFLDVPEEERENGNILFSLIQRTRCQ